MYGLARFYYIISILLFLGACKENPPVNELPEVKVKKVQNVDEEALSFLHRLYADPLNDSVLVVSGDTLETFSWFAKIRPNDKLIFTSKGRLTALGDSLLKYVLNAREYGLVPEHYHARRLQNLSAGFYNKREEAYNVSYIAAFEAFMNDAYLKFAAHLSRGRFRADTLLFERWNPNKLDTNWKKTVSNGLKTNDPKKVFESLEPAHPGYRFLRMALKEYLIRNQNINWDSVSFGTGMDSLLVMDRLKSRLTATGDYHENAKRSDSLNMAMAIKNFQRKFNLDPDGKLGKYTRQALSLDKELVIRQIEMALERWRWEPVKLPEKYVMINIPSAEMNVWEWDKKKKQDTLVINSMVVVGKPETPTPVLNSKIYEMLVYPYWNVPFTIAWKEILPMVQKDTNYLHKHNFEVIGAKGEVIHNLGKLKWKKYNKEYLPVRFRQRIGDENSLGICKFNFHSKYGIYLHDTNSKRYFKTFYRYQSHGCIRLEKYVELAKFLIREDTLRVPYDTLDSYFKSEVQRKIRPKKPLPIFVRYYTVTADSTSTLNLYLDIYKLDRKMMVQLYPKQFSPSN